MSDPVLSLLFHVKGGGLAQEAHVAEEHYRTVLAELAEADGLITFWKATCEKEEARAKMRYDEIVKLRAELGDCTQETCCTYNMLKLTRRLFTWNPEPRYGDYYERALYNSILSTQNPKTNMMMYFVPLATGRWKMYNLPYDSFWCCTATGLENHAKYGDSIYFGNDDTLFVNLFIGSEVNWIQKGVRIRQETDFPRGETTTLTVRTKRPTKFGIRLRVPYWATQGVYAKLNGRAVTSEIPAGSSDADEPAQASYARRRRAYRVYVRAARACRPVRRRRINRGKHAYEPELV